MTAYEVHRLLENQCPVLEKVILCPFLLTEVNNELENSRAELLLKAQTEIVKYQ